MRTPVILLFGVVLVGCETHRPFGDDLNVRLIAPLAGAGTGSPYSAVAGKPTLRWTTSSAAQTFQVQVDDSCDLTAPCTFPSPEIDESGLTTMSYVTAVALAVPGTAPRRQRYHWRVRACRDEGCGEWSPTRYFVVGQDLAINRDLDGDGYTDFLIGAPNSSAVLAQAGQAFVYLGGPTLPAHPVVSGKSSRRSWRRFAPVCIWQFWSGFGQGAFQKLADPLAACPQVEIGQVQSISLSLDCQSGCPDSQLRRRSTRPASRLLHVSSAPRCPR